MRLLLLTLLLPFHVIAQNAPQRQKLEPVATYEEALRQFIGQHPEALMKTTRPAGHVLFIKRQAFLSELKDTVAGVRLKFINPATDVDTIVRYARKKEQVTILDLQEMLMRDLEAYIWILPMHSSFNAKKKLLGAPAYGNTLCQYSFDYGPERDKYYYFKQASCKEE